MAPRLKRLGYASLSPRVSEILERNEIFTVEDFFTQEINYGAEDPELQEARAELSLYLQHCHGGWENGRDMLEKTLRASYISTGFESLDSLLGGGWRDGTITELVGPSSSGKTQLCFHAAASVASRHKLSVAYVDASSSFSAERVLEIITGRKSCSITSMAVSDDVKQAMLRIYCYRVYDVHGLLNVLHSLHDGSSSSLDPVHLRLVIVDCLASVLSPILGGNSAQGHALMVSVGQILKKIAINRNIGVLITNNTVAAAEGEELKPALGESWKSVPHVRLMLAKDHDNNSCTAKLVKHTSMACNVQMSFSFDRG